MLQNYSKILKNVPYRKKSAYFMHPDFSAAKIGRKKMRKLRERVRYIQCVPLATEPGIEDIATKFEQEYVRCVTNEEECVCSVCL